MEITSGHKVCNPDDSGVKEALKVLGRGFSSSLMSEGTVGASTPLIDIRRLDTIEVMPGGMYKKIELFRHLARIYFCQKLVGNLTSQ